MLLNAVSYSTSSEKGNCWFASNSGSCELQARKCTKVVKSPILATPSRTNHFRGATSCRYLRPCITTHAHLSCSCIHSPLSVQKAFFRPSIKNRSPSDERDNAADNETLSKSANELDSKADNQPDNESDSDSDRLGGHLVC
jgi:hypothetical protein